jgi:nicotinamide-nucleotide amidase
MNKELTELADSLGRALEARHWMLAPAESCTGGQIAKVMTDVSGSSSWFDRGFVTYSNVAKTEMLGVEGSLIEHYGAVSEPTVRAMAEGALKHSTAQVTVAVSGIAGPEGGTPDKPVGTVWIAWATRDGATQARLHHFRGDRRAVRDQATFAALRGVLSLIEAGSRG